MTALEQAKSLLAEQDYTCVIYAGAELLTSKQRGVKPLLGWYREKKALCGASCADRVVGNGAAYLYVLLRVREVYAEIISQPAVKTLQEAGIAVSYATLVPAILNRAQDGFCPIEQAVKTANSPEEALILIETKLKML